jgi:hypothetical protein
LVWATTAVGFVGVASPTYGEAQEVQRPVGIAPRAPAAVDPEQERLLKAIKPFDINRTPSGSVVYIFGPNIERIDLTGVFIRQADGVSFDVVESVLLVQLEAAVARLGPLTLRKRPVKLAITFAQAYGGRLDVRVAELIDGIPVESNGRIGINAVSGEIIEFGFFLVADGTKPKDRSLWLSEQEAIALAQRAVVSERGGSSPQVTEAGLHLLRRSEQQLDPEWRILFGDVSYGAIVDALDGKTSTFSTLVY